MNRDLGIVLDIVLACRDIEFFVQGYDRQTFAADRRTLAATLHQLMIIGEATTRLSSAFRSQYPAIPWQQFAGMRDHLVHAYDQVNLDLVWQTATIDVSRLRQELEPLLPPEENAG
jgi:uncharacterized protein with HEPN domain